MLKLSFRKRLGNFQLEIDHTITEKVTAFLGPSGSGKSTLLNCISGILNPDDGELLFSGQTLYSSQQKKCLPPEKRRFGYVFQEGHLFPHLKVRQNISYGRPRRLDSGKRRLTPIQLSISLKSENCWIGIRANFPAVNGSGSPLRALWGCRRACY